MNPVLAAMGDVGVGMAFMRLSTEWESGRKVDANWVIFGLVFLAIAVTSRLKIV
jgi:TRAP-type mannitol/chloroaromatic compound transport system permease small subunit